MALLPLHIIVAMAQRELGIVSSWQFFWGGGVGWVSCSLQHVPFSHVPIISLIILVLIRARHTKGWIGQDGIVQSASLRFLSLLHSAQRPGLPPRSQYMILVGILSLGD